MKGVFCLVTALFIHSSNSVAPRHKSAGCDVLSSAEMNHQDGESMNYTIVTHDGLTRTYIVHLPTNYEPNLPRAKPVMFALPGFLTSAQEFHDGMKINGHSDDNDYIIVYPEGNELLRGNGEIIYNWNDLSSSRSPGPEGPICDTNNINRAIQVAPYQDDDGGDCSWTNYLVDDIAFI